MNRFIITLSRHMAIFGIFGAAIDGIERCRKLCGGHGFLVSAGFADLQTSYLPFCTLEGTKEILGLQAGRYLVKIVESIAQMARNSGAKAGRKATAHKVRQH
jgi:acyl-CoA oxidase